MTAQEAARVVAFLVAAFPTAKLDLDQAGTYALQIADLDLDEAQQAARELSLTSKWLPSVAEIRDAAIRRRLGVPTAAAALEQLQARLAGGGREAAHPLVNDAVRLMGGLWSLQMTTQPTVWRAQFRDTYADLAAGRVRAESLASAGVPLDYRPGAAQLPAGDERARDARVQRLIDGTAEGVKPA